MIKVFGACAVFGLLARAIFGEWVDLPVAVVYAAQTINGINFALVLIASRWGEDEERLEKCSLRERFFISSLTDDMMLAPPISMAVFCVVAFYEVFDFGIAAAAASFPLFWMLRALIIALIAERIYQQ